MTAVPHGARTADRPVSFRPEKPPPSLARMVALGPVVPILRVFDGALADEFYLGFLGFREDWEHRIAGHLPLFRQVSRDGAALHLSEHFEDGTPGTAGQGQGQGI